MTVCLTEEPVQEESVGMGQALLGRAPGRLTAILGSCVAVTLYAQRLQVGMMAHIVLPRASGETEYPAKFADTAIPHMIEMLKQHGVKPSLLVAKIVGGACMFGSNSKLMDIGQSNAQAAVQALEAAGIPIAQREVAGNAGRRVHFNLCSGALTVDTPGHPSRII